MEGYDDNIMKSGQTFWSLYPVPSFCILLRPQAKGGYRTNGQDAWMDTEITGEWSDYTIPIVNIPMSTLLGFKYT